MFLTLSVRRVTVADFRLITVHDCIVSVIKASPLCTLCNENEVMDKHQLMLRPSLIQGALSNIYWEARSSQVNDR